MALPTTQTQFAATIDQTLLNPTTGFRDAAEWAERNANMGFASLCVIPAHVEVVAEILASSSTKTCTVVGFPLGYSPTGVKTYEARHLAEAGADEIDVVVNIGALIERDTVLVRRELEAVVATVDEASEGTGLVKVILETGYLDEDTLRLGCELAAEAGAHFVKTSTGFGPRGASVRDVEVMRDVVGGTLGIKAAGGIRDLDTAVSLLEAGATRLGTSSGAELAAAFAERFGAFAR